jgi:nitroreductase
MEFSDVVRSRRMVRRYDPEQPVPAEALHAILRNATRAPSAGFSQGWDFVVLTEPAQREAFWAATTDPDDEPDAWLEGVSSAPVLVLCCSDEGSYLRRYAEPDKGWSDMDEARWPVPYWDIDAGMAALLMLLTVVDEGLGACFFGVPAERVEPLRAAFGVPDTHRPVGVVAVGYPGDGDRRSPSLRRGRRGVDEVVHRGRW